MMLVDDSLKEGDLVYLWWSLVDEKKPVEREFRLVEKKDRYLKLRSTGGNYELFFGTDDLASFHGRIRKS